MSYEVVRVHTVRAVSKRSKPTVGSWKSEVHVERFGDIQEAFEAALDEASKPLYRALGAHVRVEVRKGTEVLSIF